MIHNDIPSLKLILSNCPNPKICILDNNIIELLKKTTFVAPDTIFAVYDAILIPGWVYEEVQDSDGRVKYIEDLGGRLNKHIYIIKETGYSELIDYKEADLFYIFYYSIRLLTNLISFINRNIINANAPENTIISEIEPYQDWVDKLYSSGFSGEVLTNGRLKKKNAGDVSICVLANILSLYFATLNNITIFSFDHDIYDYVSTSKALLLKDSRFGERKIKPITFKTNDVLLHDWFMRGYIDEHNLGNIVNQMRQNRKVKFTLKVADNSVEEHEEVLSNSQLIQLITQDNSLHIIF